MQSFRLCPRSVWPTLLATIAVALFPAMASAASLTVGTVTASCGGQVSVPISVDNASGLLAIQFRVTFDSTKLTANPATTGSVTSSFTISSSASGGSLMVALASGTPAPSGGGIVANLSFTVSASAAAGTIPVSISEVLLNDVASSGQSGSISVSCGGGGTVAGIWLLTSSAHVQGAGAFWQTDLSIRNTGSTSATVTIKFLGHSGDGRDGPEQFATIPAGQTQTWRDVLGSLFGFPSEYGPILVRSTSASLAVLGQTWTSGGGGTYGQSVPALATGELIGATPRSILGVRQDTFFRTNLMLANATESNVTVVVQLVSTAGSVLGTLNRSLGPLSRDQLNVGSDFGYTSLADAVFVISSPTAGAAVGAYASVIDAGTADPRTLLPR